MRIRALRAAFLATAIALLPGPATAADFTGSIWWPSDHPLVVSGYQPWAEAIEQRSAGALKLKVMAGNQLLVPEAHLKALREGAVQVAHHVAAFTPNELPELSVLALIAPGYDDALAAVLASTEFSMRDHAMQARYKALGIVFGGSYALPPHMVLCRQPARALADLVGRKIRSANAVRRSWTASIGAVPVTMPRSELRFGLEKGLIDCITGDAEEFSSGDLWPVARQLTTVQLGSAFGGWQYAFGRPFWRRLEPAHRRLLLDTIAERIPATTLEHLAAVDRAREMALSIGLQVHAASPAMQQSFDTFVRGQGRQQALLLGTSRFGLSDTAGLLARFEATYAKWQTLLAAVDRSDPQVVAVLLKREVFDKVDERTYGMN